MAIDLSEIKRHPASDWYIESVPARPLMVCGLIRGFVDGLKLKEYTFVLCHYNKGNVDWITLIDDQNRIGGKIFEKYRKDRAYWRKEFKRWVGIKKNLEKTFKMLRKKDLSKSSEKEILADMKRYVGLHWGERKTSSLIDPYMFYAERKLTELLQEFSKRNPALDEKEAFGIITMHEDASFTNAAELDMIRIAKEISKDKQIKERFMARRVDEGELSSSKVHKMIIKHIERFPWLKVQSFFGAEEYAFEDVAKHIRELLNSDLKKEETKNLSWKKNKKIRKDYLKKNRFGREIMEIAEMTPLFAKWQDMRKECTLMTTYLDSKYIKEISKRKGIEEDSLTYLDYTEFDSLFRKDFDLGLLKKRKEGCLFIYKGKEFKVFYGNEMEEVINKIIEAPEEGVREIKGVCASPGKASGRVKIVIKIEDMIKMEKGDVLVSTMTRPEHTPAMKKAAAIVTNEGGVTCHAAVISRELGIPCIIGTKIATHVLKEGDFVEVDADKGIIKKL